MGQRVWILLAMTHLTFDLSLCSALSLTPPPVPRPHPRLQQPLRDTPTPLNWRTVSPLARRPLSPPPSTQHLRSGHLDRGKSERRRRAPLKDPHGEVLRLLLRARRQLKWESYSQEGRTTTVAGFIDWGPTGTDEGLDERNFTLSTSVSMPMLPPTTSSTPQQPHWTLTVGTLEPTTTRAPTRETVKPAKPYENTPGLAVHQIITITVSLIMVIAALITTLVLKNCCAQSGNSRHNSHQRKIHQQEESCQNLTDFTPARVPSKVDIFTAYDSLQCSHECLRGGVPIYTDEMIQQTPVYKSAYNGNRPSPTERQLIPVAFVSEKWFEISC